MRDVPVQACVCMVTSESDVERESSESCGRARHVDGTYWFRDRSDVGVDCKGRLMSDMKPA